MKTSRAEKGTGRAEKSREMDGIGQSNRVATWTLFEVVKNENRLCE